MRDRKKKDLKYAVATLKDHTFNQKINTISLE